MTDLLTCFRYAGLLPPFIGTARMVGGSVAEWLACWMDSGAEGPGFKSQPRRCRVTVLGKLFTLIPIVPLFAKQQNW